MAQGRAERGAAAADRAVQPVSDRYEIELWGYTGGDLRSRLGGASREALDRGELQVRTDLLHGSPSDFEREQLSDRDVRRVADDCAMHPLLPLHVECAWANSQRNRVGFERRAATSTTSST